MALPAQTLIDVVQAEGYSALSQRDALLALCGYFAAGAGITAQQAVVSAAANNYHALSDRDLNEALLAVLS